MNIVNYKGTNLRVSDIALGGGVLGSRISDQASFDILDCFVGKWGVHLLIQRMCMEGGIQEIFHYLNY